MKGNQFLAKRCKSSRSTLLFIFDDGSKYKTCTFTLCVLFSIFSSLPSSRSFFQIGEKLSFFPFSHFLTVNNYGGSSGSAFISEKFKRHSISEKQHIDFLHVFTIRREQSDSKRASHLSKPYNLYTNLLCIYNLHQLTLIQYGII